MFDHDHPTELVTSITMADPEAGMLDLQLPRGTKPSRKARSTAGGDASADKQPQPPAPPRYQSKTNQTAPALPDGRRCDTCPNTDSEEDPTVKKLKARHGENFQVILDSNPKFFNLLRVTADGTMICWWGFAQKVTGETQNSQCGYCISTYNARIRPRKITLKAWKAQLGSNPKMLESHCKAGLFMVDAIVEKGVPIICFVCPFG